ncbi:hypothetical protein SAZ10_16425 [Mesorhizobium sp. BAC0120]|uniref:hypothetical protein n=1 Tax=Mesorhizobium sp. BAC0120 TaxID=3090670 RepID=UPI00298D34A5|nr:hypothetical protein [Mesorhizobium sp. BAC0120]MDW6023342.1 hypothetical protein [Mesorhizobium sp. BAC0120]
MALAGFSILQPEPAAAAGCAYHDAERLGRDVARHFEAKTLNQLGRRLPAHAVRLHIGHSIDDGLELTDQVAVTDLEARLSAAETADPRQAAPQRQILGKMQCRGLSCEFGPFGILHNNLYLQHVRFARSGGCLTLAEIELLDGD